MDAAELQRTLSCPSPWVFSATYRDMPAGLGDSRSVWFLEHLDDHLIASAAQGTAETGRRIALHGRSLADVLCEEFYSWTIESCESAGLLPGEFRPFIWRNGIADFILRASDDGPVFASELDTIRTRAIALHLVQKQLAGLFEVVEPSPGNANTYGGTIQQLHASAAREVESILSVIFDANFPGHTGKATMTDYFRLAEPMRLAEWEFRLRHFPGWPASQPFRAWSSGAVPLWWTAYNKLKHKPAQRAMANMQAAIESTAAARILLEAAFGPSAMRMIPAEGLAEFAIHGRPRWKATEVYFPPRRGETLKSRPLG